MKFPNIMILLLLVVACSSPTLPLDTTEIYEGRKYSVVTVSKTYLVTTEKQVTYAELGKTFGTYFPKIHNYIKSKGVKASSMPLCFYTDTNKPGTVNIRCGMMVSEKIDNSGDITCQPMKSFKALKTNHIGPYGKLGNTHNKIVDYLNHKKTQRTGPHLEIYISDPGQVPVDKWVTEIYYPID